MKVLMHLGLGDTIACAAIIAKLASENDFVEIPCWQHNAVSVTSIFAEIKNIIVLPFTKEEHVLLWAQDDANLMLGCYNQKKELDQGLNEDFVLWFYRQAGMDVSEKDKWCPIAKTAAEIECNGFAGEYNFIHDDASRGFNIQGVSGIRPYHDPQEFNGSVLRNADVLKNAKEIHCIDSSFLHLVECLPTTGKLFYHKYARPNSTDYKYLKKEWQVLE